MLESFFSSKRFIQQVRGGPLGSHLDGLATLLLAQGYCHDAAKHKLGLVVALGRWLDEKRCALVAFDEVRAVSFLKHRQCHTKLQRGDLKTLRLLLERLRLQGVVPALVPKPPAGPLEVILDRYTHYLVRERGLSHRTVAQYRHCLRTFLTECFAGRAVRLNTLCQADTNQHLRRKGAIVCPTTMHGVTAALRSFFTYLQLRGEVRVDLASGVPAVACWRLATVPKFLQPEEVQQLLDSCDRATAKGRRDYAILLLLARLGLRAGELVSLRLEDLHWDAGEMLIRGKGQLHDRLPMLQDVGRALAKYLRHGRPQCPSRQVFVRINAPHQGLASPSDISTIVRQAIDRVGLQPPNKGAHLLRHSLATTMLRRGASLAEIGEVLRHRCPNTTELYSKVDVRALQALSRPWPGEKS